LVKGIEAMVETVVAEDMIMAETEEMAIKGRAHVMEGEGFREILQSPANHKKGGGGATVEEAEERDGLVEQVDEGNEQMNAGEMVGGKVNSRLQTVMK
jgi:hypothetical protein